MTLLRRSDTAIALRDADEGRAYTYAELRSLVDQVRTILRRLKRPAVAFLFAPNSVEFVAAYLACLEEQIPLGLGDPAPEARSRVIAAYRPSAVLAPVGSELSAEYKQGASLCGNALAVFERAPGQYEIEPHAGLALMLTTSGSTGDPKFVRLTLENLKANASSIAEYLVIGPGEAAIESLPLHYSYGLSVLNSHLLSGATVVLTNHSFIRPEFWRVIADCGCTSFAGVPYMYETLHRLRWQPKKYPSLRTLTQAGGHLRAELVTHFCAAMRAERGRFFVMYGQTEATARIAYVPADRLSEKSGSIGVAIPRGRLWLEPVDGDPSLRQLHYKGPNVMMGYATSPADLARGDEMGGVLPTGDLAECDSEGFFRLTGRLARFAKLYGKRVNLAGVEAELEREFGVRVIVLEGVDRLRVFVESGSDGQQVKIRNYLAEWLGMPPLTFVIVAIDRLPMTASGKKDYKALK